jgi:hypothetical protein
MSIFNAVAVTFMSGEMCSFMPEEYTPFEGKSWIVIGATPEELQFYKKVSYSRLIEISLAHELGHFVAYHYGLDYDNEYLAWLITKLFLDWDESFYEVFINNWGLVKTQGYDIYEAHQQYNLLLGMLD